MKSLRNMTRYLFIDLCFNLYKMPIEIRTKYLKAFSKRESMNLGNGVIFKYGIVDYVKFRDQVEDFSLSVVAWGNDYSTRFLTTDFDTYIGMDLFINYVRDFDESLSEELYEIAAELILFDRTYNCWRLNFLNYLEEGLGLCQEFCLNLKEELLDQNNFFYAREYDVKSFLLSVCTALLSGGEIDDHEKVTLASLFLEFNDEVDHPYAAMVDFLNFKNTNLTMMPDHKERLMAFCSTLITCDGEIAKKEVKLFDIFARDFSLKGKKKDFLRQYCGQSIKELMSNFDNRLKITTLFYGLEICAADGILHPNEVKIIDLVLSEIEKTPLLDHEYEYYTYLFFNYVSKHGRFVARNRELFDKIFYNLWSERSNECLECLFVFKELVNVKRTSMNISILEAYIDTLIPHTIDFSTHDEAMMLYKISMALMNVERSKISNEELKKRLKLYIAKIDEDDFGKYLGNILDFIVLDNHIEVLEDHFFVDLCLSKNITDGVFRREIFISSFLNSHDITVTDFLNYSLIKA